MVFLSMVKMAHLNNRMDGKKCQLHKQETHENRTAFWNNS